MSERRRPESPEDLQRRLSKTVFHAAERGRESLFKTLTAANADKLEELMRQKPLLYERQEQVPSQLLIDDEVARVLPPEFFADPTGWIESQQTLSRTAEGVMNNDKIADYWDQRYDTTKVKTFDLADGKGIVSKRLMPEEVETVTTARRAHEAGIPTPAVVAEIAHHGNAYVWYERIEGVNMLAYDLQYADAFREPLSWAVEMTDGKGFAPRIANLVDRLGGESEKQVFVSLRHRAERVAADFSSLNAIYDQLKHVTGERSLARLSRKVSEMGEGIWERLNAETLALIRHLETAYQIPFHEFLALGREGFRFDEELRNVRQSIGLELEKLLDNLTEGLDIRARRDEIVRMCAEKGFEHDDLADRNFVVALDPQTQRPERDETGKPKVYIVDWQSQPTTSDKLKDARK